MLNGGNRIKITNGTLISRDEAAEMLNTTAKAISQIRTVQTWEPEKGKSFPHGSTEVTVRLSLFTRDRNVCSELTGEFLPPGAAAVRGDLDESCR